MKTGKHSIDLSTTVLFQFPNGGCVVVYNSIDRDTGDFRRIFCCAKHFAEQGRKVTMTPKMDVPYKNKAYDTIYGSLKGTPYYGKCPDLNIDGDWYEHEGFVGSNPKRSFRNMCNHGLKQSNRIIIEECGLTDRQMRKSITERIKRGILVEELWIHTATGLRLYYKNT